MMASVHSLPALVSPSVFPVDKKAEFIENFKKAGYAAVDKLAKKAADSMTYTEDLEELSSRFKEQSRELTAALFEKILNSRGQEHLETDSCPCPKCGKVLRKSQDRRRSIDTEHGRIALMRPYFYCRSCHLGTLPFDDALGFAPTYKQYDLKKKAAKLLAEMPYEKAASLFKELTGTEMSDHCMHNFAVDFSQASEIARVLPTKHAVESIIEENSRGKHWRPVLVVAADGAHLPTRPEADGRDGKRGPGEWKEAKGFRIYLVGEERIVQIMSWHQIMDESEFGQALQFAASLIPQNKVRIALVADGALWIWKHFQAAFPGGKEILDYFHCSEHMHKVGELLYPDDSEKEALWIEAQMARLNEGEVQSVIWGLQRTSTPTRKAKQELDKLITYLKNNAHRIDYKKMKRSQYPRGSGGIESANKFICHVRMKRSGAWWYTVNGNAMLRLRCALYNGTFDETFREYKKLESKKGIATNS